GRSGSRRHECGTVRQLFRKGCQVEKATREVKTDDRLPHASDVHAANDVLRRDPSHRPWLTDYLPELAALDEAQMPAMSDYERWLGPVQVTPVPVPHDCSDGFLYAYWRRPTAYLDPHTRSGSSSFWAIGDSRAGLQQLRRDLETGE